MSLDQVQFPDAREIQFNIRFKVNKRKISESSFARG